MTLNVEANTLSRSLSLSIYLSPSHIRLMLEFWKLLQNYRRKCHFRKGRNSNCFKSIKRVHSWYFLNLTETHSVEDRKWFFLTRLVSLRIFYCWKIRKFCFSSKIMHLSRHNFEQWAWSFLKFTLLNRDA